MEIPNHPNVAVRRRLFCRNQVPHSMTQAPQDNKPAAASGAGEAATVEVDSAASAVPATPEGEPSKIARFGSGSINKLMLEFAIPAIAGVVINGLYNIIDSIFLGQGVGALGLAATTVAVPTMTIMLALAMLVGMGGNALCALKFGEGKIRDAERTLGNSFTLLLIMGVLVAIIGFVAIEPLLAVSGSTAESHDMSKEFIQIICLGFVFQGIGFGLNNFIRTAGSPNRALLTMVIGAVVCTLLNYLFVMQWGWGVRGSALATVIGQAFSAAFVLSFFLSKKAPFRLRLSTLPLTRHIAPQILLLGLAPFALQLAAALVNVVLNTLLASYGALSALGADGALASLGVVSKVAMFTVFPIIGVAQAAQPLLGYNYGAHLYPRVRKTFLVATLWATILACMGFALVHIIPGPIISLFGVDEDVLDFATLALQVYLFCLPLVGAQIIGSNYFQATGQSIKSMVLTLTRQLLFLIPLFYVCPIVLPQLFGVEPLLAINIAAAISDAFAFVVTLIFVIREMRRLSVLEKAELANGQ